MFVYEANRSTVNGPNVWFRTWNSDGSSFQLLELLKCILYRLLSHSVDLEHALHGLLLISEYTNSKVSARLESFWEWVPPILLMYEMATWLSIISRTWITCFSATKLWRARKAPWSSNQLIWCSRSLTDHSPPVFVSDSRQYILQPRVEASVSRLNEGAGLRIGRERLVDRLYTHHIRSCCASCDITTEWSKLFPLGPTAWCLNRCRAL